MLHGILAGSNDRYLIVKELFQFAPRLGDLDSNPRINHDIYRKKRAKVTWQRLVNSRNRRNGSPVLDDT
jgi:hypothetical protein